MSGFYQTGPDTYDAAAIDALCGAQHMTELTARALLRRGVDTPERAEAFLHPLEQPLCDPLTLPDMAEAVVRICYALKHDELICIYGDYDADGICACAILIRTLEQLGGRILRYIPSRHTEGYGLNPEAVRKLARAHVRLLITVDNGVSAFDEIALCRNLGVDVIVTDHHSIGSALPECCAVVSAKRRDSAYKNPHLCGAGVALKLAQALLPTADHRFDLALAAVATIADVVPVLDENRAIIAQGIRYVAENPGFLALLTAANFHAAEQPVGVQTVAFLLAPRLNASGRMGDAMRGVELLLAKDEAEAMPLAQSLDADNTARRNAENGIAEQALLQVSLSRRALIARHVDWNPGVTGIVASRLCETYHRPAILFSERDGVLTGSGRCPEGIDLYAVLTALSRYFVRYGGHARAAGITLTSENYAPFCEAFYAAMETYDEACFAPAYAYEEAATVEALSMTQAQELERLAPFGEGNPEPTFLFQDVTVRSVSAMGKNGAHLSALVEQNGASLRTVAFRRGELATALSASAGAYDIIARPAINRFRGRESVELYGVAIEPADRMQKLFDAIFCSSVYNGRVVDAIIAEWYFSAYGSGAPFYSEEELRGVYTAWHKALENGAQSPRTLALSHSVKERIALLIFMQLGFFELDVARDAVKPCDRIRTTPLTESGLYRRLTQPIQEESIF